MPNKPRTTVSVCMPAYNSSATISDAIDSVVNQSFQDWELIVVDDKSSDDTADLVKDYCRLHSNIRLIEHETNSGPAAARDEAIENSAGRYIAFLDSDDIWHKEKLSFQVNFMAENGLPISFHSYWKIDRKKEKISNLIRGADHMNYDLFLKHRGFGNCLTMMVERSLCQLPFFTSKKFLKFDINEDFLPIANILSTGISVPILDRGLAYYRISDNSRSSRKLESIFEMFSIYLSEVKLPFHKRLYYCFYYVCSALVHNLTYPKKQLSLVAKDHPGRDILFSEVKTITGKSS